MKVSIITPSHDTKFLRELEETILAQTYSDWEWIILLNQGAQYQARDERVKIIDCPFVNDSVGFLKRLACMQASGEIIAEVDHDDLIVPTCLEKLVKAFEDPEIGFVFSQNAKLSKDFRPYLAEYGWTHSFFNWKGKNLYAMNNQPVYPGRLGQIYFAPDHVRAWRKYVYESIGGHDDSLNVCDDLDLMHRLYKVTKFKEIPEVLYIYRINGNNTYIQKGEEIRTINEKLYNKNIEELATRFSEINSLGILELSYEKTLPDLLKIGDNSIGLITAYDWLQYVKDTRALMEEIHRILAPGGMLLSETPSTDGRGAFQDPAAASYWNENSFWYYTRPGYAKRIRNSRMFRECRLSTFYRNDFEKEHKIASVRAHLEKLN